MGGHSFEGGQEDGCVCNSRAVPHQDPGEASHEGRSEEHLRQGDEGCGKASQDDREGLPGSSIEEADLEQRSVTALLCLLRGLLAVGIPWCRLEMGSLLAMAISVCTCILMPKGLGQLSSHPE